MSTFVGISSNVQIDVMRRVPGGWSVERIRTKNLITTEGLTAWAYNIPKGDGEVIDRVVIGSSSTAPALGDTDLGTPEAIYTTGVRTAVVADTAVITFWLIGANRDTESGVTMREIGLFTTNTGATPSSDKFIAHAVVPDIPIDGDTIAVIVWNLTVGHADVVDGATGTYKQLTDYGKNFIAGRIVDLSLEAVLDKITVGTSVVPINPREAEKIIIESLRKTPNTTAWGASGAVVSCVATVTNAEAAIFIKEIGAAVGATVDVKTLYQEVHPTNISADISSSGTADLTASITLANV